VAVMKNNWKCREARISVTGRCQTRLAQMRVASTSRDLRMSWQTARRGEAIAPPCVEFGDEIFQIQRMIGSFLDDEHRLTSARSMVFLRI